jgi:hypothetical protein
MEESAAALGLSAYNTEENILAAIPLVTRSTVREVPAYAVPQAWNRWSFVAFSLICLAPFPSNSLAPSSIVERGLARG